MRNITLFEASASCPPGSRELPDRTLVTVTLMAGFPAINYRPPKPGWGGNPDDLAGALNPADDVLAAGAWIETNSRRKE